MQLVGMEKILDRARAIADTRIIPIKKDIMNIYEVVTIMWKVDVAINKAFYKLNIYVMHAAMKAQIRYFLRKQDLIHMEVCF